MTSPDTVQSFPFFTTYSGIADTSGNCTLQGGPTIANEEWTITSQHVTNPGPRVPVVLLYKDFVAQAGFIEGTTRGTLADSDSTISLQSCQVAIWVWSGCSVGTVCTVTIRGTREVAF